MKRLKKKKTKTDLKHSLAIQADLDLTVGSLLSKGEREGWKVSFSRDRSITMRAQQRVSAALVVLVLWSPMEGRALDEEERMWLVSLGESLRHQSLLTADQT